MARRAARCQVARPLLAACCALLLYVPFLSRRFDPNGIRDALAVDRGGAALWNPNHLLYRPIGAGLDAAARSLDLGVRSMAPLQELSALNGAITVGLALLICWRLCGDWLASALAAGLLATSWAQWSFSTDATYVTMGAAAAAAAIAWVLATDGSTRSVCAGGVLCALAVLSWEANIFLLPVLAARLWMIYPERRLRAGVVLTAACGGAVLSADYAAAAARAGTRVSLGSVVEWASLHGGGGTTLPMWGVWSTEHIASAGHAWMSSLLPLWEGLGLRGLARGELRGDKVLSQLAALALLGLVVVSVRLAWPARRRGRLSRSTFLWFAAGVGAYLPFIVWWVPAPQWFLVPNLFLAGAAAIVWSEAQARLRLGLALAIATIAAANFSATIWPAHVGVSPHDALARCVVAQIEPRDLVVVTDWGWLDHAEYWYGVPADVLYLVDGRPREEKLGLLAEALERTRARGGRGYVMEVDRHAPEKVAWLQALTQLLPEDLDRFAPRPAFTCAGVPFVELTGESQSDGGGRVDRR